MQEQVRCQNCDEKVDAELIECPFCNKSLFDEHTGPVDLLMPVPAFTKGPWRTGESFSGKLLIVTASGESIAMPTHAFRLENEANARLIASAPKLYSYLKMLYEKVRYDIPMTDVFHEEINSVLTYIESPKKGKG